MKMGPAMVITVATALLVCPPAPWAQEEAPSDAILGLWYTEDDQSMVEITEQDGEYRGRIVWLQEPYYTGPDAEPNDIALDANNPKPGNQEEPVMNLPILWGFTYDESDAEWVDGKIYDPEKGKTYSCQMEIEGDTLKVRGYIGAPLFGRTTEWVRATEEHQKTYEGVGMTLEEFEDEYGYTPHADEATALSE